MFAVHSFARMWVGGFGGEGCMLRRLSTLPAMLPDREASNKKEGTLQGVLRLRRASPALTSLIITAVFFAFILFVLHPGYWINDDLAIVWNMLGYPGTLAPTPFMVYGNVLLGMVLSALYGLQIAVNWQMVVLTLLNACAVWGFLFVLLSSNLAVGYKAAGALIMLAAASPIVLNITFTITAALAGLSGMCLVLTAADLRRTSWIAPACAGVALIVAGSLVRIQMAVLMPILAYPVFLALGSYVDLRRLMALTAAALGLAAGCFAFDAAYVRSSPDWQAFYSFNAVAAKLQDSHRLENLGDLGRQVGWTENDVLLYRNWFMVDESLNSRQKIQYLVEHTQGTSGNPRRMVSFFLERMETSAAGAAYLMCLLGLVWWTAESGREERQTWYVALILLAASALNILLGWAYKDPDYVLLGTFGGSVLVAVGLLATGTERKEDRPDEPGPGPHTKWAALLPSGILILMSITLLWVQLSAASRDNAAKHVAYQGILDDLGALQSSGKIAPGALIFSPASGLPFEWSNPFELSLPSISYLDTGWTTFSPTYMRALREFGIGSLPPALYEKDNLYLMCPAPLRVYLGRYYWEHLGVEVRFDPIYAMPNTNHFEGYDDRVLYKVVQVP
jgi:hypothetical protein